MGLLGKWLKAELPSDDAAQRQANTLNYGTSTLSPKPEFLAIQGSGLYRELGPFDVATDVES